MGIKEIGGTTEKGQKMLTKDQVFPIYKAAKDSKDQGGFHDFVEILKLYDKNDDNTMLSQEEAKSLMKELCEPADDEGFMPFIPFLERMCAAEKKITIIIGGVSRGLPLSHQYTPAVSSDRDLGVKERGDTSNIPEKNLILSLQNTKSNVAALLRTRS